MKIILAGETFDYDNTKTPMSEALWVEHVYKRRFAEWQSDLSAGSAKAMCVLACLIWRREGRDVPLDDLLGGKIDFDLLELLGSLADAADAEAGGADAAEAAAPDPTPSPAPAGTPGTGTGTSGLSPSTSTSGRGKSTKTSTSKTSTP